MRTLFYFLLIIVWRIIQIVWEWFWRILLAPFSLLASIWQPTQPFMGSPEPLKNCFWYPEYTYRCGSANISLYFMIRYQLKQYLSFTWKKAREHTQMKIDIKGKRDDTTLLRPYQDVQRTQEISNTEV